CCGPEPCLFSLIARRQAADEARDHPATRCRLRRAPVRRTPPQSPPRGRPGDAAAVAAARRSEDAAVVVAAAAARGQRTPLATPGRPGLVAWVTPSRGRRGSTGHALRWRHAGSRCQRRARGGGPAAPRGGGRGRAAVPRGPAAVRGLRRPWAGDLRGLVRRRGGTAVRRAADGETVRRVAGHGPPA